MIRFARENKIPFLGICLGMQLAAIEFARHVLGHHAASSEEFTPMGAANVIHLMESQKDVKSIGATMRLGSYPCDITSGTLAQEAYGAKRIDERHRHRFEFNNSYRIEFENAGMKFSGVSPTVVSLKSWSFRIILVSGVSVSS